MSCIFWIAYCGIINYRYTDLESNDILPVFYFMNVKNCYFLKDVYTTFNH